MHIRFVIGPAGSGKTFLCLSEIRQALRASAEGLPLLWLAPKQATFQMERQLLSDPELRGYTRLKILSFERLAKFVFQQLRLAPPEILSEEGRLMVLRALLTQKRDELKLFRASARLSGFAQQLNLVLRELQQDQLTPERVRGIAMQIRDDSGLSLKLHDLALILEGYLDWLARHRLQDAGTILDAAVKAISPHETTPWFAGLWLDGFAEMSQQELALLAAILPRCEKATLAFCAESNAPGNASWLSHWATTQKTLAECRTKITSLPGASVTMQVLPRRAETTRFKTPALQALESNWATGERIDRRHPGSDPVANTPAAEGVRIVACKDPEAEAVFAAREILRFVRSGGRYRETGILVRSLERYHEPVQRVFARYGIPCFLDRRESVAHHPLAELTRSALRVAIYGWAHDDWFAALKTGLVPVSEDDVDWLENEALARGWKGSAWNGGITSPDNPDTASRASRLLRKALPAFQKLTGALEGMRPTGVELAGAVREFWSALAVERQLEQWGQETHQHLGLPAAAHDTVWEQMLALLENLELAFGEDALASRDWLPIIEAGLAHLTVGVIPPALDQVLVGAVDRSRNPDLKLALVLGLNEESFPRSAEPPILLTDDDRNRLKECGVSVGANLRERTARERYYGYIACTRASHQLVLAYSRQTESGKLLNPSPFVQHIRRIFEGRLTVETFQTPSALSHVEHVAELASLLADPEMGRAEPVRELGAQIPAVASLVQQLSNLREPRHDERLAPALAEALYGPVLRTSVSRLEQFAECPFRFFVHSGLRANERKLFELDARERGSFQHDALKRFHEQLLAEGKRWRDITPQEARERMAMIISELAGQFRDGLMRSSAQTRFTTRILGEALQDFVEVVVGWMRSQYQFDPVAVELEFGSSEQNKFELDLGEGHALRLQGRIDRVDLCRDPEQAGAALAVVIDYKSSRKTLDSVLLQHGIQLQLLAYLNVLRRWPGKVPFGEATLQPAGVFYVNLIGQKETGKSRSEALAETAAARKLAYRHTGRFDASALPLLDATRAGDQFYYRLTQEGVPRRNCAELLSREEFQELLSRTESTIAEIGRRIYSGDAAVSPYRKGSRTPCEFCDYRTVCRTDPWTQSYRVLKKAEHGTAEPEPSAVD